MHQEPFQYMVLKFTHRELKGTQYNAILQLSHRELKGFMWSETSNARFLCAGSKTLDEWANAPIKVGECAQGPGECACGSWRMRRKIYLRANAPKQNESADALTEPGECA